MKLGPVAEVLFHADRQTDKQADRQAGRQTDVTYLKYFFFRNFANALKNSSFISRVYFCLLYGSEVSSELLACKSFTDYIQHIIGTVFVYCAVRADIRYSSI
jgi:1,4-dihydroxy-2-naphthoate octaprenyltransferase